MAISEAMIQELEHETATGRKLLKRIPEENLDWKPHQKSWSLLELSCHLANLLTWTSPILDQDEFEMPEDYQPWRVDTKGELLAAFDENVSSVKEKLSGYSDEKMMQTWTMKGSGQVYFSYPRVVVMRSFVLNHFVHHRGQLSVYLRLNDIPVPSIYGPSADEA